MVHADDLEAVSVDEALIEVSSKVAAQEEVSSDPAKEFAESLRAQVFSATGCAGSFFGVLLIRPLIISK